MKVVLSGLFYPVAILRYYEAALRRRDDVELYTVGPYSNSWIPWNGGMHLPQKYANPPTMPFPNEPTPVPIEYVERKLPWDPDVWIQVDAGWHMMNKPRKGKNVIVATDPHVLNYDRQRGLADTFYCMQAVYARNGDEYLPYAYDPVWHAPEDQERQYDACLIGLKYEQRNAWVNALRVQGLHVFYELGPSYDEARALYNQAPIGLNWSSLQDLVARVFELLGMGRLAVVNRVPDLSRFFVDGADLLVFDNLGEAVERVKYAIDNPEEARAIADQGRETVKAHTWDARVQTILEAV